MSHLTDAARAPYRIENADHDDPNSLEAIVAANPSRRKILVNGLFGLALAPMVAGYRKFNRPFWRVWQVGSGRASAALGTDRAQIGGSCVGFRHRGAAQRLSA
ncbi:hypothetical protein ACVS38_006909 [Pseudomonas aeruginosa]|nr:hypothetical protein [Pseudomonas aeruginosa]EKX8190245.1 hypothetical protein [Pseudomonas aeruginosa]